MATWFGAGLLKPGPGTYGSVVAVLLWAVAASLFHPATAWLAVGTALAALAATLVGIPAATIVAREAGREDPGFVVVDEVAGQWIALIAVRPDWRHALLALLLFRLFDIWKPWSDSEAGAVTGRHGDHAGRCGGGSAGTGVRAGIGAVGIELYEPTSQNRDVGHPR